MKALVSRRPMTANALGAFAGALYRACFRRRCGRCQGGGRKVAGPQTTWEGPTKAPKPEPGKKIVFLSGDEQNDISHLYGVYIKEAGEKLGWNVTVIDGKGSPTSWLAQARPRLSFAR